MPGYTEGSFQSVLNKVLINDIKAEMREADLVDFVNTETYGRSKIYNHHGRIC